MRYVVQRWAGIETGWITPAYCARPKTKERAKLFARTCAAINGNRWTYRVAALPPELPDFL